MQKKSVRKLSVSTQNKGFGDLPSSRMASPRNFARDMVLGAFRALTGGIFVPILLPNMSGDFLTGGLKKIKMAAKGQLRVSKLSLQNLDIAH